MGCVEWRVGNREESFNHIAGGVEATTKKQSTCQAAWGLLSLASSPAAACRGVMVEVAARHEESRNSSTHPAKGYPRSIIRVNIIRFCEPEQGGIRNGHVLILSMANGGDFAIRVD
jgi:hypothetical protein